MAEEISDGITAARDVAFIVFPGFQILDLSGPLSAFEIAGDVSAQGAYRCTVVSPTGGEVVSSAGLSVFTQKLQRKPLDTLIVVGGAVSAHPDTLGPVADQLAMASVNGSRRIASVCTGAFILASAGLLDGRRATTHWKHASHLRHQFPKVKVEGDRIFIKDGPIWTSAGVTAGIDLALAMIEEDLGSSVSHATAQMMVVYHRRPGGQSQFSALADMEPASDRIRDVLTYIREHLTEPLSTEQLAAIACLSPRQFGRTFLTETGETPAKAVERLRVEVARQRVESGGEPIEIIASSVGFSDPERMRRAFIRVIGHPPQTIRRMAGQDALAHHRVEEQVCAESA
ncbi:GlxA family transcriptional regulator [Paraburkholderia strydomiana]|jgi:transcriptional regulator GlxA family with amidase domain|uniref:GlxA family transcriptional regulator n=1 Tax=Paraburkholderia strydomiana TaxID=1245417 RepID=A0ABW9ERM2_9BURK